jgi:precorrin-6B methylase 2
MVGFGKDEISTITSTQRTFNPISELNIPIERVTRAVLLMSFIMVWGSMFLDMGAGTRAHGIEVSKIYYS